MTPGAEPLLTRKEYVAYKRERRKFVGRWLVELFHGNYILNKSLRMWDEPIRAYEKAFPDLIIENPHPL